ncbi:DUF4231 domain-containing protein [Asanoa siamensis]|nr:DUF4231 domain-containing protein [Asanoa siamensis]
MVAEEVPGRAESDPADHDGQWELVAPVGLSGEEALVWRQLQNQYRWYNRSANRNRLAYQGLKVGTLAFGAAVTVMAAVGAPGVLTAVVAAGIVFVEGLQQVFQFHPNWLSHRGVAESLRLHGFLFKAGSSPYDNADTRRGQLAHFLQDVATRESSAWASTMAQQPGANPAVTAAP